EDGIRDFHVTGVQTCALPILGIRYEHHFVEQSPEEIYSSVLQAVEACRDDMGRQGIRPDQITEVGLTNQRETFLLWDAAGKPLYNAISWQCKRSSAICDRLKEAEIGRAHV